MSKKEVIVYSVIFLLLAFSTFDTLFYALTRKHSFEILSLRSLSSRVFSFNTRCSNEAPIKNLSKATDPYLQKLEQFQSACGSLASRQITIYTDIPKDEETARKNGNKMADTLDQFSRYGVSPIVIVEPITDWGVMDIQSFKNGQFDAGLRTYFGAVKERGISDEQMGTWVPFPEANLPYWNRTNIKPDDFALVVNRYLGIYKNEFPDAKGSILLNSATYETPDFAWSDERYLSLAKYVEKIDKGLVDSFGLQGLPWTPPISSGNGRLHASNFLNPKIAMEAADILGTRNIWLNTGSFSRKYSLDPINMVTLTPLARAEILSEIQRQAQKLKESDYAVSVNIYSPDKSEDVEATDWSYWKNDGKEPIENKSVLVDFVSKLYQHKIGVSFYDDPS